MKTHVSYAGTYEIDGDDVVHNVKVSSFPNWTGTDQRRQIHFERSPADSSSAPFDYDGEMIMAHAIWEDPRPPR